MAKCQICQLELVKQQGTTEQKHVEQLYCPNCEKCELIDESEGNLNGGMLQDTI